MQPESTGQAGGWVVGAAMRGAPYLTRGGIKMLQIDYRSRASSASITISAAAVTAHSSLV